MTTNQLLRNAVIGTGILFGIALALDYFFDSSLWEGMVVSKSALTVKYCEFNHPNRLFHQPINTYSNLIYFFFGLVVFQLALKDMNGSTLVKTNTVGNFPYLSLLLAANFIYLSVVSAFFHSSLTWIGQRVDMNATYGLTLSLICLGLVVTTVKKVLSTRLQLAIVAFMLLLTTTFLPLALQISSSILLPSLFLLLFVIAILNYFRYPRQRFPLLGMLGVVLLVVAIQIRALDVAKVNCDPYSIWQGHALWHLLTATSSLCLYFYFRMVKSEAKAKG